MRGPPAVVANNLNASAPVYEELQTLSTDRTAAGSRFRRTVRNASLWALIKGGDSLPRRLGYRRPFFLALYPADGEANLLADFANPSGRAIRVPFPSSRFAAKLENVSLQNCFIMAWLLKPKVSMFRAYYILLALPIVCATASAEGPSCVVNVPVNVVLPNNALVRGLDGHSFVARNKSAPLTVQSFSVDRGPRRIAFVLETGKSIPRAARKIGTSVISGILSNARAEDSFALLTAHGPRKELRFGTSRVTVQNSLEQLAIPPEGRNQIGGVLDAVLEAVGWFQQPQPGDAIVLITMGIESPSRTSYGKVRDALAEGGIRLFGFQLGPIIGGYYRARLTAEPGGVLVPIVDIDPNEENLFALGGGAGGFVFVESAAGDPRREYKPTEERLHLLSKSGGQIYKAVIEYYRLRLETPKRGLVLDLADPVRKQFRQAEVIYPRYLPGCSPGPDAGKSH